MDITFFECVEDTHTDITKDISWPDVVEMLSVHRRGEKNGYGFSPVTFTGKIRTKTNVGQVHLLCVDLDKDAQGQELSHVDALRLLSHLKTLGHACVCYSTHSYAPPDNSTWRVVFELSRPVTLSEFGTFWPAAIEYAGLPSGIKTDNPARFWYLPSCPEGADPEVLVIEGTPIDVDALNFEVTSAPAERVSDEYIEDYPTAPKGLLRHAAQIIHDKGQAIEGKGGDQKTFAIAKTLINDLALSHDEAWPLFRAWNTANVPPWDEGELKAKLHGEYASESYGRERCVWGFFDLVENPRNIETPGTSQHALVQAREDLDKALLNTSQGKDLSLMFRTAREICAEQSEPTPWLVDGILTAGGVGVLATEPKSAKTWAATEIAVAVSTGTPAFGEFASKQGRVAYFYAEDMVDAVRNRIQSLAHGRIDGWQDDLYCEPRGRELDICNDESLALLLASARQVENLSLLILDPFRDIHGAAEDSSDEMSQVMRRLRVLGNLLNCTIFFVHHSAKSGADTSGRRQGQRMRGSSAIHGGVDSGLYFSGLSGDGESEFINQVTSEVKGARSAGHFNLALRIEDGPLGTAIKAEWEVTRGDGEIDVSDESITELIDALGQNAIRMGPVLRTKDIQKITKGTRIALERTIEAAHGGGLIEKQFQGSAMVGWRLSAKGDTLFADISGARK